MSGKESPQRVTDGNVIYANFGTKKRVTDPKQVNQVERVNAGASALSTAATRVITQISREVDSGRLSRGREYARAGNVVGLDIRVGAIHGQVAGSQNEPFSVLIQLPYRSKDDLTEVTDALISEGNSLDNAREGKLSDSMVDILYAPTLGDIRFSCSCPDPDYLCKHIVAVADRLAARIDADASVIFSLRGLDFPQLEQLVIDRAQEVSAQAVDSADHMDPHTRHELFWSGREMPELPRPKIAPALDDSDMDLLRKAMRAVSHTSIDLLRAVSDVEDLYYHLNK